MGSLCCLVILLHVHSSFFSPKYYFILLFPHTTTPLPPTQMLTFLPTSLRKQKHLKKRTSGDSQYLPTLSVCTPGSRDELAVLPHYANPFHFQIPFALTYSKKFSTSLSQDIFLHPWIIAFSIQICSYSSCLQSRLLTHFLQLLPCFQVPGCSKSQKTCQYALSQFLSSQFLSVNILQLSFKPHHHTEIGLLKSDGQFSLLILSDLSIMIQLHNSISYIYAFLIFLPEHTFFLVFSLPHQSLFFGLFHRFSLTLYIRVPGGTALDPLVFCLCTHIIYMLMPH